MVPFSLGVRLHEALDKALTRNQLFTVPGGGHGGFTDEWNRKAYEAIREFLGKYGLGAVR